MSNLNVDGILNANQLNLQNENLLEKLYPVGTLYFSLNPISPSSFLGMDWVLLDEGKTIWTTKSEGGGTIEAGLPNIIGSMKNGRSIMGEQGDTQTSGAFSHVLTTGGDLINLSWSGAKRKSELSFDASKSNSIYGKSNTVQPPAIRVFVWKRI